MYGVHRAVAADFTGTGKKDIVATNFLPDTAFPQRQELNLDSILFLEQTRPGHFERHSLERVSCDHVTCAVGDVYGTGRTARVTASSVTPARPDGVLTIGKNMGRAEGNP